ncbi:hypothetical protein K435DRAFT_800460 [Dendrothele bispora CBS 962.96]|uniref:Uncharacterized protein n=1 Tax=Dendrothele bispora (strain CBS 962.96) TaxID=1314807 RepID=A0A4S8LT25_DENBC|nr:hypothetical protein K435DRAFT_800460 [Dendrothele bispora CBS 962.96]
MPPRPNVQPNNFTFMDHLRNFITLLEHLERSLDRLRWNATGTQRMEIPSGDERLKGTETERNIDGTCPSSGLCRVPAPRIIIMTRFNEQLFHYSKSVRSGEEVVVASDTIKSDCTQWWRTRQFEGLALAEVRHLNCIDPVRTGYESDTSWPGLGK